jgi:hypothetical protein
MTIGEPELGARPFKREPEPVKNNYRGPVRVREINKNGSHSRALFRGSQS